MWGERFVVLVVVGGKLMVVTRGGPYIPEPRARNSDRGHRSLCDGHRRRCASSETPIFDLGACVTLVNNH